MGAVLVIVAGGAALVTGAGRAGTGTEDLYAVKEERVDALCEQGMRSTFPQFFASGGKVEVFRHLSRIDLEEAVDLWPAVQLGTRSGDGYADRYACNVTGPLDSPTVYVRPAP